MFEPFQHFLKLENTTGRWLLNPTVRINQVRAIGPSPIGPLWPSLNFSEFAFLRWLAASRRIPKATGQTAYGML